MFLKSSTDCTQGGQYIQDIYSREFGTRCYSVGSMRVPKYIYLTEELVIPAPEVQTSIGSLDRNGEKDGPDFRLSSRKRSYFSTRCR